ncbi:hypothetical protein [Methylocapsa sp. S129]|nr:hypothetical protein [Methylocapsa sp. S129]
MSSRTLAPVPIGQPSAKILSLTEGAGQIEMLEALHRLCEGA